MTSKRARHVSGKGAVWHMSSEQATLAKMPKYNGYACGYGAHGNVKYHRAKSKRAWKAQMQKEGASWGSFLIAVSYTHLDVYKRQVQTMRYFDADMYRYFIGRDDQSVNEKVMLSRIDQQIRVTKTMIDAVAVSYTHLDVYKRQP